MIEVKNPPQSAMGQTSLWIISASRWTKATSLAFRAERRGKDNHNEHYYGISVRQQRERNRRRL